MTVSRTHRPAVAALFAAAALCVGCAQTGVLDDARRLAQAGQHEAAWQQLQRARAATPDDNALRAAELRQRAAAVAQLVLQIDLARGRGDLAVATAMLERAARMDPAHPRVQALRDEIERSGRHQQWLAQARTAETAGDAGAAQALVDRVLAEAPGHPAARALQSRLRAAAPTPVAPELARAFARKVDLELRDAPLRQAMEGLARSGGLNFVFDRDVRGEARVSVMLRDIALDEALRVILHSQQLAYKVLNDRTLMVYPATPAKLREHQELVTRSFYLTNADARQAQAMVRSMVKSRDLFVDERLNLLMVRDTPQAVALVERLLAGIDIAEPEVVLDVEVLELASGRLDELGLQWPEQVTFGLPGSDATVEVGRRSEFRAAVANPALLATLRETASASNTLANPRLRARNREKARVLIGEKLPVFTTTSTANVGVSASVSYLDVGLKLEVEPTVLLDQDVVMKVGLEVSTLIGRVAGPQGSVGYQIGTRQANTSLRLRDGETQVLAGLIRDEDGKTVAGVPGLADLPVVGRLFGLHSDSRVKTEVVLLITPRIVRVLGLPDADSTRVLSGPEAQPGAPALRLSEGAVARVPVPRSVGRTSVVRGGGEAEASSDDATAAAPAPSFQGRPAEPGVALVELDVTARAAVGDTVSVAIRNRAPMALKGELSFDATLLAAAQSGGQDAGGRLSVNLAAGGEQVVLLRVLPAAAGQAVAVHLGGMTPEDPAVAAPAVQVRGDARIEVQGQP